MTYSNIITDDFFTLFSRMEYLLKRGEFSADRGVAKADWHSFSRWLGEGFYSNVIQLRIADTLINHPPRRLMADGLVWLPENPNPLINTEELIIQGVCRVRNNLFHGEKFYGEVDDEKLGRDTLLVSESMAVLKLACDVLQER